ncbi:fumarylacetoacetate hydrolase family protein [Spirillospora sp. NPDC047279]|uniref:2-keto-4-pentenoate hydratase n=1 Tax=Spirillospora sp. NPDC047279 TaxID=3155478 RepID=UPI0033C44B49
MTPHDPIRAAADRLRTAQDDLVPCPPVRDLLGVDDIDSAYAVQDLFAERRIAAGARLAGRKIGLTSPAVQRQLGVDQPDFGVLFDDMDVSAAAEIPVAGLLQPKIEAEIAFVLGTDLDREIAGPDDVRDAVVHAVAALEIVDSRIAGWDIKITDTVADNGSSGLFVLGDRPLTLAEFTPADVVMELRADGVPVSKGDGAACLGDPLNALAWLAAGARRYGRPLRAGEVVLSGALGPMVPVTPGTRYEAEITGLGVVTASFTKEAR